MEITWWLTTSRTANSFRLVGIWGNVQVIVRIHILEQAQTHVETTCFMKSIPARANPACVIIVETKFIINPKDWSKEKRS